LFSGLIYTLPDVVNPIEEFSQVGAIENNMVCLLVVATVFLAYAILLIWSKYQDNKDILRVKYKIL
jgi:cell division protein FtsL